MFHPFRTPGYTLVLCLALVALAISPLSAMLFVGSRGTDLGL
jgi:hypothetical protein